ncbi:adenosine kinase [Saccharicrinis sp. FJH54]|uniref:adenosine kinase n=1 Tax=Saccharicrinis sp. FJH54 TaxID=3344665 RepID=UPI0035D3EAE4
MKKVLGFGNALVDIMLPNSKEQLLNELGLGKGSMTLIDDETLVKIDHLTSTLYQTKATGGSAANTINGLSKLGIETGFIGKVGKDEIGTFFETDLVNNKVKSHLLKSNTPAGRAFAFVTSDSERTFATYLGASIEMRPEDLDKSWFTDYDYLYVEGYLVQDHKLIETGMKLAKEAGLKIVLDLASYNVVEANKDFLASLITNYVDIVFANEEEALSFTSLAPEAALNELAEKTEIAVVKTGAKGSLIAQNKTTTKVDPIKVNPIDTTGAGDLYAAGFLFGLIHGYKPADCGKVASVLSGNVIEVLGAKMDEKRWEAIKETLSLS